MLRLASRLTAAPLRAAGNFAVRAASSSGSGMPSGPMAVGSREQGSVPDVEGLAGPARAEAMLKKAFGEDLFDRDATAYVEEGTRENPIPILSIENNRIVGVSLPDDATIRWFTLKAGELVYDPNTCNWFALKKVSKAEVDEWVNRAEAANAAA